MNSETNLPIIFSNVYYVASYVKSWAFLCPHKL